MPDGKTHTRHPACPRCPTFHRFSERGRGILLRALLDLHVRRDVLTQPSTHLCGRPALHPRQALALEAEETESAAPRRSGEPRGALNCCSQFSTDSRALKCADLSAEKRNERSTPLMMIALLELRSQASSSCVPYSYSLVPFADASGPSKEKNTFIKEIYSEEVNCVRD
mgnify:CR=1 FL=1